VIALNHKGEWGCATNIDNFAVSIANEEGCRVYHVKRKETHCEVIEADSAWVKLRVEE
jgi:hypothetical protein